jgi:molybdopterin converting factor small subunit
MPPKSKLFKVTYFALLKDQRGLSSEDITSDAVTALELYEELQRQWGFSLAASQLKVAINNQFANWQDPLPNQASIVFIPPVAGG